jgi:hypothetical protein
MPSRFSFSLSASFSLKGCYSTAQASAADTPRKLGQG